MIRENYHSNSVLKVGHNGGQIADDDSNNRTHFEDRIIAERVVEKEILVPKVKTDRGDESDESMEIRTVKQKVIEIAKRRVVEKIVTVPEYEYREKIVSVLEKVRQERIREVPVIEYQERITEVPKIVYKEKEVKVPEYEYVEVVTYKDVEVITYEEEHVINKVIKPVIVEKPAPEYVDVYQHARVDLKVPFPLEAVIDIHFELPKLNVLYKKVEIPVSVPKFVEVPVPAEYFPAGYASYAEHQRNSLNDMTTSVSKKGVSQLDFLTLSHQIENSHWDKLFLNEEINGICPLNAAQFTDQAFKNGEFKIDGPSMQSIKEEFEKKKQDVRKKFEGDYNRELKDLKKREDAALQELNKESELKRARVLEEACERARNQARHNLTAAGLDPTEYLNDTYSFYPEPSAKKDDLEASNSAGITEGDAKSPERSAPSLIRSAFSAATSNTIKSVISLHENADPRPFAEMQTIAPQIAPVVAPVAEAPTQVIAPKLALRQIDRTAEDEEKDERADSIEHEGINTGRHKKKKRKNKNRNFDEGEQPIDISPHSADSESFRMNESHTPSSAANLDNSYSFNSPTSPFSNPTSPVRTTSLAGPLFTGNNNTNAFRF